MTNGSRASSLLMTVWVLGMGCLMSCGSAQSAKTEVEKPRPNILLVTVDTLRADHMSLYGYERPTTPQIDAFFSRSMVFETAYAPTSFTPPSVVTILSGQYPAAHRVRMVFQKLPAETRLLPDFLKALGYHTAAVVSNMVLTDEATGLGSHFDYYDDFVDQHVEIRNGYERDARRTTDAALDWIQRARSLESPHFAWVHYMDPHGPYRPPQDTFQTFDHPEPVPFNIERVPIYNRLDGITDGAYYVDRYDEEIAFADAEIGRFLAAYQREFPDSVIVFTSDHGEYLMDHGSWFTHGFFVYEPVLRVPLMVMTPTLPASRESVPVAVGGITPMLLEMVGIDTSESFPIRSPMAFDPDIFVEGLGAKRGTQYRALIRGSQKWVLFSANGVENPSARVYYDLGSDPGELNPQPWPSIPEDLLAAAARDPDPSGLPKSVSKGSKLTQAKQKPAEGLSVVVEGVDEDELELLRTLGYVQ